MNRNTTLILVVVFAALLLYVLLVQRPADEAKANATPTTAVTLSGSLWAGVTADQILNVRVEDRAQGRTLAFGRADATAAWTITEPSAQAADQVAAAGNAATLVGLTYQNTLTPTTDLANFGVLSPTYVIQVDLVGGATHKLIVGDKAPTGSAYYAMKNGEPALYVLSQFSLDQIVGWIDSPPVPPTATPEVTITPTATITATATLTPSP